MSVRRAFWKTNLQSEDTLVIMSSTIQLQIISPTLPVH